MCIKNSVLTCREYCKTEDADLILDYDVCLHQYFCDCYPCPKFQIDTCDMQCNDNGKIAHVNTDHMGCRICDCQCPIINCTDFCVGFSHEVVYNQNLCPECKCTCPVLDCDLDCEDERLGIIRPKDERGCPSTCPECKKQQGGSIISIMIMSLL